MTSRLYQAGVVALILTQMGVVMGLTSPGLSDTDIAVVSDQVHLPVIISTAVVYLIVLLRPFVAPARFFSAIGAIRLLLPLLLFAILSAFWSSSPPMTMRRSLFLVLSTLIAVILGSEFDSSEIARLFGVASVIHMALCAVFMVVAPYYVYSPSDPQALKGLTTHKNVFGLELGLATLVFALVPFRRFPQLRFPLTLLALVLLVLSHSAGSLVATVVAVAAVPLLLFLRLPGHQRIPVISVITVFVFGGVYWLIENASLLPALLSKDATLTGRTQLWSLILIAIRAHPLLGYGFDSFWQGLHGDSLTIITQVGWLVPTAHNGYLELMLSGGWIGVLLFLPFCLQTLARCFRYASPSLRTEQTSARWFPFALLVFLLIYNLNESALLTRSGMPFMLWVAISTSIGLRMQEKQWERHSNAQEVLYNPIQFAGTL